VKPIKGRPLLSSDPQ